MKLLDMKLSIVYRVLKALAEKEQLLVTEAMAIAGTSTFHQRYLPLPRKKGIPSIRENTDRTKRRTLHKTDRKRQNPPKTARRNKQARRLRGLNQRS